MTRIFETVDAVQNRSTVYDMAAGDEFIGTLGPRQTDWVRVELTAGQTYSFGMVGLGAVGTGVVDPFLRLFNANGVRVAANDDGGPGLTSALHFTAQTSGTFYISASSLQGPQDALYGLAMTEGKRPSLSTELAAAELYRPGLSWADTPETPVTITWGVRASGPAQDASGNSAPFSVLTAAQIAAVEDALGNYSDVCGAVFDRVNPGGTTNDATILVGGYTSRNDGAGAYAIYPGSTGAGARAGDMWINNDAVSKTDLPVGSYEYFVFLHELGHAMGLDHPGDYNAAPGVSITYAKNAQYVEDSQQYTVMSYFSASDTEANSPISYCDTLMLHDIYALQQMYGVNTATRAGNTVYGFNSTEGGAYDFTVNDDPLMCIWDGAGTDTLDLSGFSARQRIDLQDGAFSNVGGFVGNLSIAIGAMIENAVGGSGKDRIDGNALANELSGGDGVDTLNGGDGGDVLVGDAKGDIISGDAGDDTLSGGVGSDLLDGGAGNDLMTGDAGRDGFVFAGAFELDTVTDFVLGQDVLFLEEAIWGGGLTVRQVLNQFGIDQGSDILIDFGTDEILLENVASIADLIKDTLLF